MSSNICEQCGGQKTLWYKIEPVMANGYTSAVVAPAASSSMKICTCPIPTSKPDSVSKSPRDTQFKGFAEMLIADMVAQHVNHLNDPSPYITIIARRAYDLVQHTVAYMEPSNWDMGEVEMPQLASDIPDLTEWPKERAE